MFLSTLFQIISLTFNTILWTLLNLIIFANVYLTCCFIKRQLGQRVRPDGQKTIIITGATSGFGLVMAKYFHKMGFTVIATHFNKLEPGYKELSEISSATNDDKADQNDARDEQKMLKNYLFLVPLDISSRKSIDEAKLKIDMLLDKYKLELFCLVNNAGIASDGPFQWVDTESVVKVVETNLLGVMVFTRQFIYRILKSKGRIVNVSSVLHAIPCLTTSVYGSTKSGVAHFSDALNFDIRRYGSSSRCIIPGNLMSSTNIIFTRFRNAKKAIDLLSEEERVYHDKSIRKSMAAFGKLALQANETTGLSPNQLENIYGVPENQLKRYVKKRGLLFRCLQNIAFYLSGSIGSGPGCNIDSSYVTKSFDDAVRLIDCPSRVYTGNFMYTNYFGPLIDLMPYEFVNATISAIFRFE